MAKRCTCDDEPAIRSGKKALEKILHRDPQVRYAALDMTSSWRCGAATKRKICKKALTRPGLFKGKLPCARHDFDLRDALDEAVWTLSDTDRELAKRAVPWRVEQLVARLDEANDARFLKLVRRPRPAVHALGPLYFATQEAGHLQQWLNVPTPPWRLKLVVDTLRARQLTDLQLWKLVEGARACEATVAGGLATDVVADDSAFLAVLLALHDPRSEEPGQRALRDLLRKKELLPREVARRDATPPSSLPTTVPAALALYDSLGLDGEALLRRPPITGKELAAFERSHRRAPEPVRRLLLGANGLGALSEVGGTDELPSLQADLAAVLEDDLTRAREEGRPVKEKTYRVRDLRRYLPLSRLYAVGRTSSGDIAFVDSRRHDGGKFPVYTTNHELLFGCDLLTHSYAEFVASVIVQAWRNAQRP